MRGNILNRNLRAKVSLAVVIPLLIILGILTFIEHKRHEEALYDNMTLLASHSGSVVESNLRHAMLKNDFSEVRSLLDTIGEDDNFQIVYVLDTSGEVIFAPNREGVGTQLDNSEPECQACHRLPAEKRPESVIIKSENGQRVFRSMHLIENSPECVECHDSDERILGLLLTDISVEPVEAGLAADLRENIIWWIGGISITVLIVNIVLNHFVLSRLDILTDGVGGVAQGKLPDPIEEKQPDEIGQLANAFNYMVDQIKTRNQENLILSKNLREESTQRGELLKRLITAQEDERTRVARELHDEMGQSLSALALCIEALEQLIHSGTGQTQEYLDLIQSLIRETIDQMYNLILDLRPSALDDLGLPAALRGCLDRLFKSSKITYELETSGFNTRLSSSIETALYRIFQEALTNIARHANAHHIAISLAYQDGIFEGTIIDDGVGFDTTTVKPDGQSTRGLGLMGMQERVSQLCGILRINSTLNEGTRVSVKIPIGKETPCE